MARAIHLARVEGKRCQKVGAFAKSGVGAGAAVSMVMVMGEKRTGAGFVSVRVTNVNHRGTEARRTHREDAWGIGMGMACRVMGGAPRGARIGGSVGRGGWRGAWWGRC